MADSEAPYRFEEADGYCVMTLLPALNQAPWGDINAIGTSLLQSMKTYMETHKKAPAFLVDLSNLHYIGSAMVALVVRLWKASKENGGRMVVINNDEMVLEVLRLSGLEQVWTITESRDAGLKSLGLSARKAIPQPAVAGSDGPRLVSASSPSSPDPGESSGSLWAIMSLMLLVIALIGLFLFTADPPPVADLRIGMGMLFGGCVLALVVGSFAACRSVGLPKTLGATVVLGALTLLVAGVVCHPKRDDVLLKPVKVPEPAINEPDNNKAGSNKTEEQSKTNSPKSAAKPGNAAKTTEPVQKTSAKTGRATPPTVAPRSK